jgi:hypothetical protein
MKRAWKVGQRVVAMSSGWEGEIVRITRNLSSPYKVRWDKNGRESNENAMSVKAKETT